MTFEQVDDADPPVRAQDRLRDQRPGRAHEPPVSAAPASKSPSDTTRARAGGRHRSLLVLDAVGEQFLEELGGPRFSLWSAVEFVAGPAGAGRVLVEVAGRDHACPREVRVPGAGLLAPPSCRNRVLSVYSCAQGRTTSVPDMVWP
jgi:hypothetical protein